MSEPIEIKKHERDAMQHLITSVRALVSTINEPNDVYVQKLMAWTNIVEQFLDRVET
jgi:hypothetical protein